MKLELYKMEGCPYCRLVMNEIKQSGRKDVILKDINEEKENRERLIRDGGKEQVPCLFIDDKPLYESADIVKFLRDHP